MEKLTRIEEEIIFLASQGLTNSKIAIKTDLSSNDIKSLLKTIYRKLGVSNRVQAAIKLHIN